MSKTFARQIAGLGRTITAPLNQIRRTSCRATAAQYLIDKIPVQTPHGELTMYCNSRETAMYPPVYMTHEPDTLEWIDKMPVDTVFWDIGANVGIYTNSRLYQPPCMSLLHHRPRLYQPSQNQQRGVTKSYWADGTL